MAVSRISQYSLQAGFPKFQNIWDGRSAVGAMDLLASTTFTNSSTGGPVFGVIPQTYTHLQLRFTALSRTSTNDFSIYFNNVTSGTAYSYHAIVGKPTTTLTSASATSYQDQPYIFGLKDEATNIPSGQTLTGVINLYDYSSTVKFKTITSLYGSDQNGNGLIVNRTGLWKSTAAVTDFGLFNGYFFEAGSSFSLYGIR